jgi:CHASE1-domain containing sensor protein
MFSEASRRTAMERARDTGNTAMSSKVTLAQETDKGVQAGMFLNP